MWHAAWAMLWLLLAVCALVGAGAVELSGRRAGAELSGTLELLAVVLVFGAIFQFLRWLARFAAVA